MADAKRHFGRRSIFLTIFLSLLLLLLFPVSVEIILYQKMESIIKENVDRSNRMMLNQMSQAVDSRLKEVEQLARSISSHPKLQWLLRGNSSNNKLHEYEYLEFVRILRQYNQGNWVEYPFFVYMAEPNLVFTPDVKTTAPSFTKNYFNFENTSNEEWRELLLHGGEQYLPSMNVPRHGRSTEQYLTFTRSLPYGEMDNVEGAVVVPIDTSLIKGLIENVGWSSQGEIFIFDKRDQLLMTTAHYSEVLYDYETLIEQKMNDESLMVSITGSGISGWKYISVVPKAVYLHKVHSIQQWALALLFIVLVLGLLGAYYLARRQYGPVKEIIRAINRKQGEEDRHASGVQKGENEYSFIKKAFYLTWDSEQKSNALMAAQTIEVRAHFISRLVKGLAELSAITTHTLATMGVVFESEYFAVMIADVDDRQMQDGNEDDHSKQHSAMVRFIIANIGQECLSRHHTVYTTELDKGKVAFLINVNRERESVVMEDLVQMTAEMKELIETRFRLLLSVGISEIHNGLEQIAVCYDEATRAVDYKMMKGNSSVTLYREMSLMIDQIYYPIDTELKLINLIKAAENEEAAKLIEYIFHQNFELRLISLELGKCLFFNMMGTFIKVLNEVASRQEEVFGEGFDPVKRLANCRNIYEMRAEMHVIITLLCRYIQKNRSDSGKQLANEITVYLEQNYSDPMLSLQSIADWFQLTPHYLSAFYKKHSGFNLTEVLVQIRVREAKKLLADKNMTINQIAAKVGYANDAGLIRMFKKHEKITPGKYRETMS